MSWFTRNSQFMSSFSSSASKHFSTIWRGHPIHKTVLISSFSFRWLKRSLTHYFVSLKSFIEYLTEAYGITLFQNRVQIYEPFFYTQVLL